jgi:NAD(P)-dependent dehydrogenase (short-subunit alcohol dehydrogenase family)
MKFEDKVVLVTGSSRGLGKEIATGFAEEGANVVINYSNSEVEASSLSKKINSQYRECISIKADVTKIQEVEKMFSQIVNIFGKIDILVNNAAIYEDSTVWNMSEETWKNVIETDLNGVFYCTKYAISQMRKNNFGRVISISSVVGQTGGFGVSNYSAAKAGLFGFTKSVSKEVARNNITVNAVALGFMDAGMLKRLPDKIQKTILEQIPMRRWGKPEELVSSLKFLASDEASYITGQILNVNGGYYP